MSGYRIRRIEGFAFAPLPAVAEPLAFRKPGSEIGVSETEALNVALWLDANRGAPIEVLDEEGDSLLGRRGPA